jgi:hypothetical protein
MTATYPNIDSLIHKVRAQVNPKKEAQRKALEELERKVRTLKSQFGIDEIADIYAASVDITFENGGYLRIIRSLSGNIGFLGSFAECYNISYNESYTSGETVCIHDNTRVRGDIAGKSRREVFCHGTEESLALFIERMTNAYHFVRVAQRNGIDRYTNYLPCIEIGMYIVSRLAGTEVKMHGLTQMKNE